MRNLFGLTLMAAAVLLPAVWTSGARAGPADTTARALVVDWKDGEREMAAVAEDSAGRSAGPRRALSRCHAKSARGLRLTHFQAAATASRHVVIAAARSTR